MKKVFIPLVVLLVLAFIVSGCSTSTTVPTSPASTTAVTTAPNNTLRPTSSPIATQATSTPSPTVSTTAAKYEGVLKVVEANGPATPIGVPWEGGGGQPWAWIVAQTPLTQLADGTLLPNLATSYDVVTDPQNPSVTFHLRQGVKFTDGTDFNAQAVKWNFEQEIAGKLSPFVTRYWSSINVIDDYTVQINMNTWLNKSVASFSNPVAEMVSPTAFEKNGIEWMRNHLVGTGAFMQSSYQQSIALNMVKNPNYWEQGKPYLDEIDYLFVPDELTAEALLKSGGAQMLDVNYDGRVAQELQNAGYSVIGQPSNVAILVPDSADADSPWSNLKVREAADYAIDKQAIVKALGFGFWEANDQLNTPNNPAYDKSLPARNYDVDQAKQLLTEAGYPNGFKTTLIALNTVDSNALAAIQSYLGKVGIQVNIRFVQQAYYNTVSRTGATYDDSLVFYNYMMNANPTQGMNGDFGVVSGSWKYTTRPPGWGDALNAAMTTAQLEPALVQKAEDVFYNNVTAIPLWSQDGIMVQASNVQDANVSKYPRGLFPIFDPLDVWLSK